MARGIHNRHHSRRSPLLREDHADLGIRACLQREAVVDGVDGLLIPPESGGDVGTRAVVCVERGSLTPISTSAAHPEHQRRSGW